MSKVDASRRLRAWSRLGVITNDDGDEFRPGDVCKVAGAKGQYRIIGIDQHRSGLIELILRREVRGKVGKVSRVDIDDAIYVEPPYRAVF